MQLFRRLRMLVSIFCVLLFWGCASAPPPVTNFKTGAELAGMKVLTGQLRCYSNEVQVPCVRGWRLLMMGENDESPRPIVPDSQGFVYLPIEQGKYTFPSYNRYGMGGVLSAKFDLNPYLEIMIRPEDEVINFGTLEFRYMQSTGSKVSGFLFGVAPVHLKMEQKPEYEPVETLLSDRFGLEKKIVRRQMTLVRRPNQGQ